jgi:hypothetical protein
LNAIFTANDDTERGVHLLALCFLAKHEKKNKQGLWLKEEGLLDQYQITEREYRNRVGRERRICPTATPRRTKIAEQEHPFSPLFVSLICDAENRIFRVQTDAMSMLPLPSKRNTLATLEGSWNGTFFCVSCLRKSD